MTYMTKPNQKVGLLRMSNKQLREGYQGSLEHVHFFTADYYEEIVRRTQAKHASAILFLALITTFVAVITLFLKFFDAE